jgi:hypothetical protein
MARMQSDHSDQDSADAAPLLRGCVQGRQLRCDGMQSVVEGDGWDDDDDTVGVDSEGLRNRLSRC